MRKNILLIEESLPFSPSGEEQLAALGHNVVVCPNAQASVGRLLDERFDLIVFDLSLSSSALEGMGVIESTRAMALKIPPIVLTSGHDRTLIEWAADKIQAFRWIQKPMRAEQLAEIIEHAPTHRAASNSDMRDPQLVA